MYSQYYQAFKKLLAAGNFHECQEPVCQSASQSERSIVISTISMGYAHQLKLEIRVMRSD